MPLSELERQRLNFHAYQTISPGATKHARPKKIFLEWSIDNPVTTLDVHLTYKFDWSVEKKFDHSIDRPVTTHGSQHTVWLVNRDFFWLVKWEPRSQRSVLEANVRIFRLVTRKYGKTAKVCRFCLGRGVCWRRLFPWWNSRLFWAQTFPNPRPSSSFAWSQLKNKPSCRTAECS